MIYCLDLPTFFKNGTNSSHDLLHRTNNFYQMKLVIYGIILGPIIAIGVFGNILNLIVLTRPALKGTTFLYLKWLAVSDLMALIVIISFLPDIIGVQSRTYVAALYYGHFAIPLINSFLGFSTYLVLVLSVERFTAVCVPTLYEKIHEIQQARLLTLVSFLLPFIVYIPQYFSKSAYPYQSESNTTEYLACDNPSAFSKGGYQVYVSIRETITRFLPMIAIALLNTSTIIVFRKVQAKKRNHRRQMSQYNHTFKEEKHFRKERRLVILLTVIAIMFFVCTLPKAILLFFLSDKKLQQRDFVLFRGIANIMVTANCSLNFYVYCFCSPKVRKTIVELIFSIRSSVLPSSSFQQNNQSSTSSNVL